MRHYTSIEQSKKLLELGLNPNTADMFYPKIDEELYSAFPFIGYNVFKKEISDIPCWSLEALLELLPNYQLTHECSGHQSISVITREGRVKSITGETSPIELVIELIEWLKSGKI